MRPNISFQRENSEVQEMLQKNKANGIFSVTTTTRFIIPHMKMEKRAGINTTYVGYKAT